MVRLNTRKNALVFNRILIATLHSVSFVFVQITQWVKSELKVTTSSCDKVLKPGTVGGVLHSKSQWKNSCRHWR